MADALDSGSSGATRGGSNPLERTKEAREFYLPEATIDSRGGRSAGAQILSSARSKLFGYSKLVLFACEQILGSVLTILDESVK